MSAARTELLSQMVPPGRPKRERIQNRDISTASQSRGLLVIVTLTSACVTKFKVRRSNLPRWARFDLQPFTMPG